MNQTHTADARRNPVLLVLASGLRAALFPIPVITLFWKDEIGLFFADIMWLQVPLAMAGLGVVAAMREVPPAGAGEQRIRHLARAWHIVRHALAHHARLRSAMALSVALGLTTYVAVWLIQPWMQLRGIPAPWFGPLWAAAHLSVGCVAVLFHVSGPKIFPFLQPDNRVNSSSSKR